MYVKFDGGWRSPGGYVVPCEVHHHVEDSHGFIMGAYIRLSSPDDKYHWVIYVKLGQLLSDEEAEHD